MSKVKRYYGNWSDSMTEAKETDTLDQHGTMFVLATDYDAALALLREVLPSIEALDETDGYDPDQDTLVIAIRELIDA